eukprot:PhF_6_TR25838/c0_g1_i2/m.36503
MSLTRRVEDEIKGLTADLHWLRESFTLHKPQYPPGEPRGRTLIMAPSPEEGKSPSVTGSSTISPEIRIEACHASTRGYNVILSPSPSDDGGKIVMETDASPQQEGILIITDMNNTKLDDIDHTRRQLNPMKKHQSHSSTPSPAPDFGVIPFMAGRSAGKHRSDRTANGAVGSGNSSKNTQAVTRVGKQLRK